MIVAVKDYPRDGLVPARAGLGESIFAVFGLFILSGAVFGVLLHWDELEVVASPEGDLITRYKLLPIYSVTALILLRRFRAVLPLVCVSWLNLVIVILALASTFWSVAPEATLLRALGLLGTTGFGLYLVLRFEPIELLRLVGVSFGLCAAISVFLVIFYPNIGLMHGFHEGAWRGAFYHKNEFGNAMAWAAVAYFLLAILSKSHRWLFALCFLVAAGFVVLSQSATFLVAMALLPLGGFLVWVLRLELRLTIVLSCVIVGLVILLTPLLVGGFEAILYALGRDPDLTGRVDLWQALWSMIMNRPLFGYGYSAFWIGSDAPAAEIRNELGWSVGHSHSVWLQVWLDMGFIGVFLLGMAFVNALRAIVWNLRRFDSNGPQIQAMVLFALFVMNFVESDLLKQPSFQWALYIYATAGSLYLRRHIEGRRSQGARGLPYGIG